MVLLTAALVRNSLLNQDSIATYSSALSVAAQTNDKRFKFCQSTLTSDNFLKDDGEIDHSHKVQHEEKKDLLKKPEQIPTVHPKTKQEKEIINKFTKQATRIYSDKNRKKRKHQSK